MKTNPQAQCAKCGASYAQVEQGRREYFVPWGPYFLCDMCHRLAILEALQAESKHPLNILRYNGDTH
jgi:hypothetical protein